MVPGLVALLACQLLGEFFVRLLGLPVPGPVVGMVVLLGYLQVRRPGRDSGLVRTAEGLLRHLQLLFVPAGVGVFGYLGLLGASIVPVVAGIALSWVAALLAAAGTMLLLLRLLPGRRRAA